MIRRTLGHYQVVDKLGEGGMGEVYVAADTKLHRNVALKILPPEMASEERRHRFEREAQAIAALNHPNIVTVFSVEETEGVHFITMELVKGKRLSELIPKKGLSLERFLDIAVPLTDAVSAAHEKGIIHRDLKPDNLMLGDDGRLKILDFGLAKLKQEFAEEGISELPTQSATQEGRILGTVAYMSPEQAEGKSVDHRTDIFSIGIILYEMATGERPFKGDSTASILSSILKDTPTSATQVNPALPPMLGRIIRRCLVKDTEHRYQTAKDLRNELEELKQDVDSGEATEPMVRAPRWTRRKLFTGAAALLAVAIVAVALLRLDTTPTETRQPRFQLTLPRGVSILNLGSGGSALAISPDGQRVVFVGETTDGGALYLRDQRDIDARRLPGTERPQCPFFSPDGRWVGFGAGGKLKKIALDGGAIVTLCDAPQLRGGSWGEDGTILFSSGARGLFRVSSDGSDVRELTEPNSTLEYDHRWPHILPGGRAALFVILRQDMGLDIDLVNLVTGTTTTLVEDAGYPRYAPSGHLLYARSGVLYSAPFDLERLEITGPAFPVLEGVAMWNSPGGGSASGAAYYDLAPAGSLVFCPREARFPRRKLVWLDRNGRIEPLNELTRAYRNPVLSPDQGRLAVSVVEADFDGVFILDIDKGAWTRVNIEGRVEAPVWMPDGEGLVLGVLGEGLLIVSTSGAFEPQTLVVGDAELPSVAPDGNAILFGTQPQPAQWDIWHLPLTGERVAEPFIASPSLEFLPSFSPDGRWVAYRSHVSGRSEIWVSPYPGPGAAHIVSIDGGWSPVWSPDGKEIFFRNGPWLMSAAVRSTEEFSADPPQPLFEIPEDIERSVRFYDVTADGQRFVMIRQDPFELRPLELVVVPNWITELEARMAGAELDVR